MDAVVLDAICARLQQQLYIKNSQIMTKDRPIKRMHFIVRGRMQIEGKDGVGPELSNGDYCGEELLIWYLEKMALKPRNVPFPFLPSGPTSFLILFQYVWSSTK
jgi:murein endopeptidase